jgi:hypothetical protein
MRKDGDMETSNVRVADTDTLIAINQASVDHGHFFVLSKEVIEQLDPNGLHICWGAFPHEQETPIVRVKGGETSLPDKISFRNGSPGKPRLDDPHLRSVWLLSVREGDPIEGIIHLTHHRLLAALPEYSRPPDSNYPPDSGSSE